jgi:cytoplasmic iron level regulating protein YaaA (DUF328/UPF0246 family)
MLIVVSPAKTLDYESPLATEKHTQPDFISQASQLIAVCKKIKTVRYSEFNESKR